jgi:hypothetical protein
MTNWIRQAIFSSLLCLVSSGFISGFIDPARADTTVTKSHIGKLKCLLSDVHQRLEAKAEAIESLTSKAIQAAIAKSLRGGIRPTEVVAKFGKFIFYPSIAPVRILYITGQTLKQHGLKKGLTRVPFEYIRKDGTTVLGFALFTQLADGTPLHVAEFLLPPTNRNGDFEEDTKVAPRADGILVYVDAMPDDNAFAGYGKNDFNERFFYRDDTYYVHAKNVSDMMHQIRNLTLSTGRPIAELEIFSHGLPGSVSIGHEKFTAADMSKIGGFQVPFAKDATIRFQSCLVGANFKGALGNRGENFMNDFGRSLLTHGGTVVASNHIILVIDHLPRTPHKNHKPWTQSFWEKFKEPQEAAIVAGIEVLKTDDGRYRKVRIPSQ